MTILKKINLARTKLIGLIFGNSRNSKVAITGIVSLAVRGISIGTGIISIPITAKYLGAEQFGLWVLLSTLMNWITIADLGLVNSLINLLATALAVEDRKKAKQAVASTFYPMMFLGLSIFVLSIFLEPFVEWEKILNVKSSLLAINTRWAVTVCLCLFAVKIPLSIPRCIFTSYQEGYMYQVWIGLANILALVSLILAQNNHANLPWLLGIFFGAITLGDLFAAIHLFRYRQPWLIPSFGYFNLKTFYALLKNGIQFWVAQICAICIFQTDLIIVSRLYGVKEVGIYGVLLRLFTIIDAIASTFIVPLWPAYNDAYARSDYKWMQKTFRVSVICSLIWSISAGMILVGFSPFILSSWLGKAVSFPPQLPLFMFFTYVLLSVSQCIAVLVNALGRLKIQTIAAPLSAIVNLILSVALGKIFGLQGVTLATTICIIIFSILVVGGDLVRALRQLRINKTLVKQ